MAKAKANPVKEQSHSGDLIAATRSGKGSPRNTLAQIEKNNHSADTALATILALLTERYRTQHPKSSITLKRYNPVSIRIRILDPDFAEVLLTRRDEPIWKILDELPEAVFLQIGMVICLTPQEAKSSFANLEFENPAPLHD